MLLSASKYEVVFYPKMYCQRERQRRGDVVFADGVEIHFSLIADTGLLGRENEYMNENESGKKES